MARFIRTKDNQLFDTEYYGEETWGQNTQDSIEQKDENTYYFHHWVAGNEYVDDSTYESKIEVLKASDKIEEVVDKIEIVSIDNVSKLAFIDGRVVAVLKTFKPDEYIFNRGTDWVVFEPSFFFNKRIHIFYINKIKDCQLKIFEAKDEDIVDNRAVTSNERAIEHWLDKAKITDKILRYELLQNIRWSNDDCCSKLEKLMWRIERGKISR